MSIKWTGSHNESGILRKSEFKEKKEDLFVFGYSCKLFRDDEKAQHIDQGKHLIPWMGDESLKIDRYDARGALHELGPLEAPPGGYDWRVELTKGELDVEQLCDEERYRALHTDEDEEEMYKEEELKRFHAAGYGQVGFNYDMPAETPETAQPVEVDEPFIPTPSFKALLPDDMVIPDGIKQNAIIEKTATFIAHQGAQMEILIKTKQGDNPQFKFLNRDSVLHPYYTALIALVKAGKWPEKQEPEPVIEEKPPEHEEYLHPSLAATVIESAPSIPSIHYRPSADCDYSMLVSKMRGESAGEASEAWVGEAWAAGDVPPPGTEPLPPRCRAAIARAPVMYHRGTPAETEQSAQTLHAQYQQFAAYYAQYKPPEPEPVIPKPAKKPEAAPLKSTGLSLMKNYNTDSESDDSDFDDSSSSDKEPIVQPPEDVQVVIDKMAAYVARNGDEFAEIVRAKNDPRFTFLEPNNVYHPYYKKLMQQKRGDVNGSGRDKGKVIAPVSFSIKKQKEPDPILPKPALPYESSSDDDSEKTEKQEDKETPKQIPPPTFPVANIPPVVVYKMESQQNNELPIIKTIESKPILKPVHVPEKETPKVEEKVNIDNNIQKIEVVDKKEVEERIEEKKRDRDSPREKKKHRERRSDYRSKSETREKRVEKSVERDKEKKEKEERIKRRKYSKDELENEIISLVDNSDDLIDLTGDHSDSKGSCEGSAERAKKEERRRRAAEFLKRVGVDPAAALPASSLASAMVDTLEAIRKRKAEEEKRRRRDKRRHRDKYEYEDGTEKAHRKNKRRKYKSSEDEESDYDGTKKKKRKRDKKHGSSKNKKKRRRENEIEDQPLNIDLTNTLKELRNTSPTKDLVQDLDDSTQQSRQSSSEEEDKERRKKKEDREYSEGEWSSDSEEDSESSSKKVE